jgi:hypothetical protein
MTAPRKTQDNFNHLKAAEAQLLNAKVLLEGTKSAALSKVQKALDILKIELAKF